MQLYESCFQARYPSGFFQVSSGTKKEILKKIVPLTNKKVSLINKVNPEIIGGFILRLDDIELNASVAHQINTLKQKLSSNAISWQN